MAIRVPGIKVWCRLLSGGGLNEGCGDLRGTAVLALVYNFGAKRMYSTNAGLDDLNRWPLLEAAAISRRRRRPLPRGAARWLQGWGRARRWGRAAGRPAARC
jgi:hypothetical protein